MKKYTIFALALALCITGLTGCRRNNGLADGTIPTTAVTTAPTTHATTVPTAPTTHATTVPTTAATTVPATTELRPQDTTGSTQDTMTDATTPSEKGRSRAVTPGVG